MARKPRQRVDSPICGRGRRGDTCQPDQDARRRQAQAHRQPPPVEGIPPPRPRVRQIGPASSSARSPFSLRPRRRLQPPPPVPWRCCASERWGRSRARSSRLTRRWVPAWRSFSWTWPLRQLVAADHREVGALLGRRLQLPAKTPGRQVGTRRDPRCPQVRGHPQPRDRVLRVRPDDDDRGRRRPRQLHRLPSPPDRPKRSPHDRPRARSRCRAWVVRPAARPGRRIDLHRRQPTQSPPPAWQRTRTSCGCSSRAPAQGWA